ncbi:MAG TPA: lamin tail domain-containing protein [Candidatus Saccharimonadales bacterium]|nr:lamin tail domain-containing protein [Candidatus Saccharimonadales bacterium]
MKRHIHFATIVSWLAALIYTGVPLAVGAEPLNTLALPPLLITEVQMGSAASASEEFIELYNASAVPINLSEHGWQLEVASASASSWASPLRTIPLHGVVQPGGSYIVASQYTSSGEQQLYLPNLASASFSAGLSYAGGHIRLLYTTNQISPPASCEAYSTVVDEFEWTVPKGTGTAAASLDSRQQFVSGKTSGVAAGASVQRQLNPSAGSYVDTDNDAVDFAASPSPSPAVVNTLAVTSVPAAGSQPQAGLPGDECEVPAPGSDDGSQPGDSDAGGTEGDGSDASGNADDPATDPTVPTTNIGLLPPAITELLPNPASPQTDAADEFIELYNPNQTAFDLSGYQLQAGTTATRSYTFPAGTQLPGGSYMAFFSAVTGLSLSNSGGQVTLLDPTGTTLSASDPYGTAKDNQAWAVTAGKWQWTLTPTPNAANTFTEVASGTTAKTTAAKKAVTPKAKTAAAPKPKTAKPKSASTNAAFVADTPTARNPVHPAVLAVIAAAAVLYGAYEYRQDVANYFRRRLENRATRRENRQAIKRRGNN